MIIFSMRTYDISSVHTDELDELVKIKDLISLSS